MRVCVFMFSQRKPVEGKLALERDVNEWRCYLFGLADCTFSSEKSTISLIPSCPPLPRTEWVCVCACMWRRISTPMCKISNVRPELLDCKTCSWNSKCDTALLWLTEVWSFQVISNLIIFQPFDWLRSCIKTAVSKLNCIFRALECYTQVQVKVLDYEFRGNTVSLLS